MTHGVRKVDRLRVINYIRIGQICSFIHRFYLLDKLIEIHSLLLNTLFRQRRGSVFARLGCAFQCHVQSAWLSSDGLVLLRLLDGKVNRFIIIIFIINPNVLLIGVRYSCQNFWRGEVSSFAMKTPDCLGVPLKFEVWHDNSGGKNAAWNLAKIVLVDVKTGQW